MVINFACCFLILCFIFYMGCNLWKSKKCVCNGWSILDLMKLGTPVVSGNILEARMVVSGTCNHEVVFRQQHLSAFEGPASTSSRLFRRLRALPSSSSILQHLKVNKRLQMLISQQLYTQSLYSIHIQLTGYQKRRQL